MTSGVKFKGTINQVHLPEYDLAPNLPTIVHLREVGTFAYCVARGIALRNAGYRTNIRQQGETPLWHLEASAGDPTAAIENTHELRANVDRPDLKTCQVLQRNAKAAFGGTAAETGARWLALIETYARFIQSAADPVTAYNTTISDLGDTGPFAANTALAQRILDKFLAGVGFTLSSPVYVHTFHIGLLQTALIDYSNMGKIFTTAQLITAEGIPNTLNLPDAQWLKMRPEKVVSVGESESLKYEYWGDDSADLDIYDPATFP